MPWRPAPGTAFQDIGPPSGLIGPRHPSIRMPVPSRIIYRPVGVVRTAASDEEVKNRDEESESIVEIFPAYEEGLDGLDGYSHIFVLAHLDQTRPGEKGVLKVRPRRLLRKGFRLEELPLTGVFALDSPVRPNPIGLSLVRLINRAGRRLTVTGLDYFNGTPILDLKPYQSEHQLPEYRLPTWYENLQARAGHI